MHRIDGANHVGNQFSAGDPLVPRGPTNLTADWCNDVQGNICGVIEAAGIALAKGNFGQLLAALDARYGKHLTQVGEIKTFYSYGWDPTYYKVPDGSTLNRVDYPLLWDWVEDSPNLAADGADKIANRTKWGRGDGVLTFELPDLRGVFLRADGGGTGLAPAVGTFKANQNKAHTHATDQFSGSGGTYGSEPFEENGAGGGNQTGNSGGDEACPDHTSVWVLIRVK